MKTILQSLPILMVCVLSAAAFQAKSKPAPPKEPPIPAYLKAAASDLAVFLELTSVHLDAKQLEELQAKGQKFISAVRQAEDDATTGDRFVIYQRAALSVKLGLQGHKVYESCNNLNEKKAALRKTVSSYRIILPTETDMKDEDCTPKEKEADKTLSEARELLEQARH